MWLMRDQANVVFARKEYRASLTFDEALKTKWSKDYKSQKWGISAWIGIPISVSIATSVVAIAVGNRYLNDYITKSSPNRTPNVYIMQLPTILYVLSTLILAEVYKLYAKWLVEKENHRDE